MPSFKDVDVLIIGGGIFGYVPRSNWLVLLNIKLIETKSSLVAAASQNNQNRLHLGYHYPRDLNTAIQCKSGFDEFKEKIQEKHTGKLFLTLIL